MSEFDMESHLAEWQKGFRRRMKEAGRPCAEKQQASKSYHAGDKRDLEWLAKNHRKKED